MINDLYSQQYNPDVLSCLANLSNDEVFTPPDIVNQMLDMLPQDLFQSKETTFLDPATKSGVFLREIAKRLLDGLEDEIPNLQERIDHIFKNQLYGIAITELTSLLSRRSVYCSKYPNSIYSVTPFDNPSGNIRYKRIMHRWQKGKCVFCGASQSQYDRDEVLETHAYEMIHTTKPEDIFNMKFDVIIGNPPYQISDGGGMGTSAMPLYNKFVEQAKKLNPRYLSMIIPARWFSGGKGLDAFRSEMLNDRRIRYMKDFFDSKDCFPGVDISGGICYFLWDRDNSGDCQISSSREGKESVLVRPLLESNNESFIRFNEAVSIVRKVEVITKGKFLDIVSTRNPFKINAKVKITKTKNADKVRVYAWPENGYIDNINITKNQAWIEKYKVYIAKAYGERGSFPYLVTAKPFVGEPNTCCTETYLLIGPVESREIAENIQSFMSTRFFRFFVLLRKNTQNAAKNVYSLVPIVDFSKPWTDEELYEKYGLNEEEIAFIESMIRPMDLDGGNNAK